MKGPDQLENLSSPKPTIEAIPQIQESPQIEGDVSKAELETSERILALYPVEEVQRVQAQAADYIVGHLKGEQPLKGEYSEDEVKLLGQLGARVRQGMRENPEATVLNLDFSKNPEAYAVWSKLINRMARSYLESDRRAQDEKKIAELRTTFDLPQPEGKSRVETVNQELGEDEINELARRANEFIRNYKPDFSDSVVASERYEGEALMLGRRSINPELGRRFQAHGIAKGRITEQLRSFNQLLAKGIDKSKPFYSTPLRMSDEEEASVAGAVGAVGPYDTGSFILVSQLDRQISDGIGAVLVNEHYYHAIPTLQQRFPDIKFIKASEVARGLNQLAGLQQ